MQLVLPSVTLNFHMCDHGWWSGGGPGGGGPGGGPGGCWPGGWSGALPMKKFSEIPEVFLDVSHVPPAGLVDKPGGAFTCQTISTC